MPHALAEGPLVVLDGDEQREGAGVEIMADLERHLERLRQGERSVQGDTLELLVTPLLGQFGRGSLQGAGGDLDALLA